MRKFPVLCAGMWIAGIALIGFGAWAFGISASALAQSAAPANEAASLMDGTSCYRTPAKLPDQAVAQFVAEPAILLAEHANGGVSLSRAARALAGSDVATVEVLIGLAANSGSGIKADIATGLAYAAASCAWTRPDIARLIRLRIAASEDLEFTAVFRGVAAAIAATPRKATGNAATSAPAIIGGSPPGPGGVASLAPTPHSGGLKAPTVNRRTISSNIGTDGMAGMSGTRKYNSTRLLFRPDKPVSPTAH